jgi:nucleoside-diphosphate-sugar epimerase
MSKYDVIVTGANGFLAVHTINHLAQNGYKLFCLGLEPSFNNSELSAVTYFQTDLLNEDQLNKNIENIKIKASKPLIMLHFAALGHVGLCQDNPSKSFKLNVETLQNSLQACVKFDIEKILFPSSALVYNKDKESSPINENGEVDSSSIYIAHKLMCECNIKGVTNSSSLKADVIRLSNVYGTNLSKDTVIHLIFRQLFGPGDSIKLRNTDSVRDYLYVEDVVNAIRKLVEHNGSSSYNLFNLTSGKGTSAYDIVQACYQVTGIHKPVQLTGEQKPWDLIKLYYSSDRLQKAIDWKPEHSINYGLAQVANWMKQEVKI